MKKLLSIVLCIILCSQMFVFGGANVFVSANTTDPFFASGVWTEERPASEGFYGNSNNFTSTLPTITDGVLKFTKGDAVQFHWKNLGSDFVNNATNKTFTFKYDITVTSFGDNVTLEKTGGRRELYFAATGTYYIVEFNNKRSDEMIRTGGTTTTNYKVGNTYTIETLWTPSSKSVATTVKIGNEIVSEGTRKSNYGDMNSNCSNFVIRCEDGAIEIDNFSFSDGTNTYSEDFERVVIETPVSTTNVQLPENNYAEYSCKISHTDGKASRVMMGEKVLFSLENGVLTLSDMPVEGTYGAGEYTIKAHLNPAQILANVEVVLPNGGVVRRGSYEAIKGITTQCTIDVYAAEDSVSDVKIEYKSAEIADYTLTLTEPVYEGFEANVYNLVTSFSDAATTRAFAWTALASFIGENDMQVKYRVKGTDAWNTTDAVREEEAINAEEEYFKADITGLTPDTEYEYKIGVKNSTDEENQWGKVYTFKTASGNEEEFSFIAVSDTQGSVWGKNQAASKGFITTKAAYEEALEAVANPALILHGGDVVYNGNIEDEWNYYFKAIGDIGKTIPQFTAIGNHDVKKSVDADGNVEHYFDLHFNHPDNGGTAALDSEIINTLDKATEGYALAQNADETIYSFNYGNVHFIVLNSSDIAGSSRTTLKAQRAWLEADLKANACAKWTIVMFHQPAYNLMVNNAPGKAVSDILEKYNVDLVIQGHSHLVARSYPMKNGEIVTKQNPDLIEQGSGTVYTTIGPTADIHEKFSDLVNTYSSSNEELVMATSPTYMQAAYTAVNVSGQELTLTLKQLNGLVLDKFTITADKEKADHAGEEKVVGKMDTTCEDDGYTGDTVCTLCGKVIKQGDSIGALGHTYSQESVMTSEGYVRTCHCGDTETTPYTAADIIKVRDALLNGDYTYNIRRLVMVYKGVAKTKQ